MTTAREPTPELAAKQERFFAALATGASIAKAAKAAGWVRSNVYAHRQRNPAFARAMDEAVETGTDRLEDEMHRRAVTGVRKGIYHLGKRVAYERQYSDTLLIFSLKARRPDKYRERFEHSGPNGGAIPIASDVNDLKLAQLMLLCFAKGEVQHLQQLMQAPTLEQGAQT